MWEVLSKPLQTMLQFFLLFSVLLQAGQILPRFHLFIIYKPGATAISKTWVSNLLASCWPVPPGSVGHMGLRLYSSH
ncbi:hypothetical protein F4778DRAFT_762543, partial [Xylariomycetidae sp. FL2044]